MMAMQRPLLTIAAVLECLAGAGLVFLPSLTISLLLGVEAHADGLMIARVAGVALAALGIACWWARADVGGAAVTGTLNAITLYNAGVGLLLVWFATSGTAGGLITLLVGVLHLGLAAAFAVARWQSSRAATTQ
jgi:hypothetical protein